MSCDYIFTGLLLITYAVFLLLGLTDKISACLYHKHVKLTINLNVSVSS